MRYLTGAVVFLGMICTVDYALAVDVNFSGTVANTCTLSVPSSGTLALAADGHTLGSEETGGTGARVAIASLGTNRISISAPTRTQSPANYDATGETVGVSYSGVGGLASVAQSYTAAATSFSTPILPMTTLTVHNRIVNNNGFAQGEYRTTTVVTCS